MHNYRRIVVRLDEVLKAQGRTRYWLAQQTGISENQLSRIATQKSSGIMYETLATICDVLDCDIGEVLTLVPRN